MFPCYSLNSSHPLIPPLCPQVRSLCLHLHCCPADRFISTIFLHSTYIKLIEEDTCTPMFTAALFTIVRTWERPRCPSTDEWIKKLWYIYTREYYSAIKRNPYFLIFLCIHCIQSVERQDVRNAEKKAFAFQKPTTWSQKQFLRGNYEQGIWITYKDKMGLSILRRCCEFRCPLGGLGLLVPTHLSLHTPFQRLWNLN